MIRLLFFISFLQLTGANGQALAPDVAIDQAGPNVEEKLQDLRSQSAALDQTISADQAKLRAIEEEIAKQRAALKALNKQATPSTTSPAGTVDSDPPAPAAPPAAPAAAQPNGGQTAPAIQPRTVQISAVDAPLILNAQAQLQWQQETNRRRYWMVVIGSGLLAAIYGLWRLTKPAKVSP